MPETVGSGTRAQPFTRGVSGGREVSSSVNRRIVQKPDRQMHGMEELWSYPTTKGDCEDFALFKRRELAAKALPLSGLLLTVVCSRTGEGHAVLTVRTALGEFDLDNLDVRVRPWDKTAYTFVKRPSSTNSGRWVTIEAGRDVPSDPPASVPPPRNLMRSRGRRL